MNQSIRIVCAAVALAIIGGWRAAMPLAAASQAPQVLIESLAGRDSFELYCAPCHGSSGRGDGPVASALRARPADLTAVAQRNDGRFPRDRVRDYVSGTGRQPAAHGTTEMPVWGTMFRALESDARARERIENLLAHLESMQAPSTAASAQTVLTPHQHGGLPHAASQEYIRARIALLDERIWMLTEDMKMFVGDMKMETMAQLISALVERQGLADWQMRSMHEQLRQRMNDQMEEWSTPVPALEMAPDAMCSPFI